ncbi:MAG: aldehyde dehydrogenase family protein [Bacteroidota bacterium]
MKNEIYIEKFFTSSFNPSTGEELGKFEITLEDELNRVITNARIAQTEWANLSVEERANKLKPVASYIADNSETLAQAISNENGKVLVDALATEVFPSALAVNYYCKNAKRFLKKKRIKSGNWLLSYKRSYLRKIPCGVVAVISPWNYPFGIPFHDIITALLSGNAVILKTANQSLLIGEALVKTFKIAELPEGLFTLVNMRGSEFGKIIFEQGIDKVFFTGSVSVGKELLKNAAQSLTPVSLELGGNDAMIVCEDADLDRAVNGAVWAAFQNSGQSCGGVERIYVQENVYEEFVTKLTEKTASLKLNSAINQEIEIGCMTTKDQRIIVEEHIADAVEKGAEVFRTQPESQLPVSHLSPAILTNVNHTMLAMSEETFGPTVGVMKFKNIDEAIKLANDSTYGLTGSVWSRNRKKAKKIAEQINAGAVLINDHLMSHGLAETPWGGFKDSGGSRSHGEFSFNSMTQTQVIVDDLLSFTKKELWWHPFSKKLFDGLKGILEFQFSTSIEKKVTGLTAFLKIVMRVFKK